MSRAEERKRDLVIARHLADAGELDQAYTVADKWLNLDPNDGPFLTVLTSIMIQSEKRPIAYALSKKLTQLMPNNAASWINMGQVSADLWMVTEAKRCYRKAAELAESPRQKSMILINMAAMLIDLGEWAEAEEYALKAQQLRENELFEEDRHRDENDNKALANLSFCQLARRQWKEGWKNYRKTLGHDQWRPRNQYAEEPEWNGGKTRQLVLYGEQGLGDQITFASMLPDCQELADEVIFHCNTELQPLMERSFPDVTVYGALGSDELNWEPEHQEPTASLAVGQAAQYVRRHDVDFPGTPFLTPDPDRMAMWKALFETKKKPVIGITWQGGIPRTGAKFRQMALEDLEPVFDAVDAHWVICHYKDTKHEVRAFKDKRPDIDIGEYPWATLSRDLDNSAALIASCDMVLTMQQTAGHIAGAVGAPVWVFVTKNSQWRYGLEEYEDMPWYNCMRLIRQRVRGSWKSEIEQVSGEIGAYIEGIRSGTAEAA